MVPEGHPFLTALGGAVEGARTSVQTDGVGFQCPHRVTAAQNRREVVGFLHVLEEHGEIRHAAIEHGFEPLKPARQQGHV